MRQKSIGWSMKWNQASWGKQDEFTLVLQSTLKTNLVSNIVICYSDLYGKGNRFRLLEC